MTSPGFRLLFVCTGNIARSALASGWACTFLGRETAASAGTHAVPGQGARPQVVRAAAQMGLDLSEHRARRVTAEMATGADLVLTAGWEHVSWLYSLAPEAYERTFTLREFVFWSRRLPGCLPLGARVREAHLLRREARAQGGFWAGTGPSDMDINEPLGRGPRAWRELASAVRDLVEEAVRPAGVAEMTRQEPMW